MTSLKPCNPGPNSNTGKPVYKYIGWILKHVEGEVCSTEEKMDDWLDQQDNEVVINGRAMVNEGDRTLRLDKDRWNLDIKSTIALWITLCSVVVLFIVYSTFYVYVKTKYRENLNQKNAEHHKTPQLANN